MSYQIWLPPSEGKTPPASGAPLELSGLLFGEQLRASREQVISVLSKVSASPDGAKLLKLGRKVLSNWR